MSRRIRNYCWKQGPMFYMGFSASQSPENR